MVYAAKNPVSVRTDCCSVHRLAITAKHDSTPNYSGVGLFRPAQCTSPVSFSFMAF